MAASMHDTQTMSRRGEDKFRVAVAFLVISWFFILLRIWTRTLVISNFGWDDMTMILAGMLFTTYCAAMIFLEQHGGGTHVSNITQLVLLTKWVLVGQATYLMTIMMLKISLGIFFMRVVIKRWQVGFIYVTVGINIISCVATFFYVLLRCGPDLDQYVYRQLAEECTPRVLDSFFSYQQASFTALTDFLFAILPVFILWNARIVRRDKIAVGFILSLAALGCVCSIIRFRYVNGLTQVKDFFWNATNIAIWSTIEPGAGIVAGCLATLRPLGKFVYTQAQLATSSNMSQPKRVSRSFRSNENSASQKSADASKNDGGNANTSQHGKDKGAPPSQEQAIELESGIKRGDSTDCILNNRDTTHGPWPAPEDPSHGSDRASTPGYCNSWVSSHHDRSGRNSPATSNAWTPLPREQRLSSNGRISPANRTAWLAQRDPGFPPSMRSSPLTRTTWAPSQTGGKLEFGPPLPPAKRVTWMSPHRMPDLNRPLPPLPPAEETQA